MMNRLLAYVLTIFLTLLISPRLISALNQARSSLHDVGRSGQPGADPGLSLGQAPAAGPLRKPFSGRGRLIVYTDTRNLGEKIQSYPDYVLNRKMAPYRKLGCINDGGLWVDRGPCGIFISTVTRKCVIFRGYSDNRGRKVR